MRGLLLGVVIAMSACVVVDEPELSTSTAALVECNPATLGQRCDTDDEVCTVEVCRQGPAGPRCITLGGAPNGSACESDGDDCTIDMCSGGRCQHSEEAPWCAPDGGPEQEEITGIDEGVGGGGGGGGGDAGRDAGGGPDAGIDAGGSALFEGDIGGGGGCSTSSPGSGSALVVLLLGAMIATRRRAAAVVVLGGLATAGAAQARAQGVDASVYRPASPGAASFVTEDAAPLPAWAFGLGLGLDVARDVLIVRDPDSGAVLEGGNLIGSRSTMHVGAALGLPAGVEVGAQLPLVLDQSGDLTMVDGGALPARAAGDLALRAKLRLLDAGGVRLAAAVSGEVPLGDTATFTHDAGPVVALRLLAGASLGTLSLSFAAGHRWRERAMLGNLIVDDEWVAELGASLPVIDRRLWLVGDGYVAIATHDPAERQVPAEVLGGARVRVAGPWVAQAGIGVGLTHGYGTPSLRGLAMIAWSPDRTPRPRLRPRNQLRAIAAPVALVPPPRSPADHDRLVDREVACVEAPDQPGCAVPDPTPPELVIERIILEDRVMFDTSRARVKHAGKKVLGGIVAQWAEHATWDRIVIEGHTDDRGDDDYNVWLGRERAERARAALIALGAPADRIEIVSYGKSRPRSDARDEAARARNRRVEFVVLRRQ